MEHFERCRIGRIAGECVGCAQADRIERPARRDAELLISRASKVLYRGHQTRCKEVQRRAHAAAPTVAGVVAGDADGALWGLRQKLLKFAQRDRPQSYLVAGGEQRARLRPRLPQCNRGASDHMPAAGGFQREDAGHGRCDCERAGRYSQSWSLAPLQRKLGRQVAHIGLARKKTQHVDMIVDAAVALDHLLRREARARRDLLEIRAEGPIVAHGKRPHAARQLAYLQIAHHQFDVRNQRCRRKDQWIVIHHERAEGGHRLDDAHEMLVVDAARQRQNPCAQPPVDAVAKLDGKRRVSRGQHFVLRHNPIPENGRRFKQVARSTSLACKCREGRRTAWHQGAGTMVSR